MTVAARSAVGRTWAKSGHIPARPSWECRACGVDWPCEPAKTALRTDYRNNRVSLSLAMGALAVKAVEDLPATVNVVERIVSWTRAAASPSPAVWESSVRGGRNDQP